VPAVQVVGAVRRHDHDGLVDEAREEVAQQVSAGPVGPVQVLQHEQQRARTGQFADEAGDRLEQLQPAVVGRLRGGAVRQRPSEVGALAGRRHHRQRTRTTGQQAGECRVGRGLRGERRIGRHRPQQVDEGQVREADVAEVDAVPRQHAHAPFGGAGGELVEQPGLADTGVTGQQDGGRAAGHRAVDVRQQAGELVGPAHQRGVVPA
jgi:hypothetical protein